MSRAPPLSPRPVETSSRERGPPIRAWEMCSKADLLMSSTPLSKQIQQITNNKERLHGLIRKRVLFAAKDIKKYIDISSFWKECKHTQESWGRESQDVDVHYHYQSRCCQTHVALWQSKQRLNWFVEKAGEGKITSKNDMWLYTCTFVFFSKLVDRKNSSSSCCCSGFSTVKTNSSFPEEREAQVSLQ